MKKPQTESLTDFAERMSKESKQKANEIVASADTRIIDPFQFNEMLQQVCELEIQAKLWKEIA